MAKCSQCLHWGACSMLFEMAIGRKPTANGNNAEEKCPQFKDKTINTNADRIRAMSDEELASVIASTPICKERYMDCLKDGRDCKPCLLEWIKQPVKENDNG